MLAPIPIARTLFLLVVCAEPVGAGGEAEARAIIDRAIKAHGGAANLSKFEVSTFTLRGKCYALGAEGADFTARWVVQGLDKLREEDDVSAVGRKLHVVGVVNGNEGWVQMGITTRPMDKQGLAERKEGLYHDCVARLACLTSGKFRLAPLGESKVGGRDAVGVRVSHPGHRDISMFFDKKSGLLLETSRRAKDPTGGKKEFTEEIFFGGYKKVEGALQAQTFLILRDGKKFVEARCTDMRSHAKLDDTAFARPAVTASK